MITQNGIGVGVIEAVTLINGKWISVQPSKIPFPTSLFTNPATVPAAGFTSYGSAVKFVSGSSTGQKRDAVPYLMSSASALIKECSMMTIAAPIAITDASIAFCSYGHSSQGGLFFLDQGASSGTITFWCRDDAGTSQNPTGTPPTGVWSNSGPPAVIIGARSQSANFHRVYAGGSKITDTTASNLGNATFNRAAMGCLYYNGGTGFQYNGNVHLMVSWSRALTPAECQSLSANPWQVFDYPSRPLILDQAAQAAFIARQGLNINQSINRASTF